jgi:hypothetical protein
MSKADGVFCFGSGSAPCLTDHVDRCKVVHTPVGIKAFVSESIVRERYTKVHHTYNRIRRALAGDCNEYLPFYRLHDDMIVEIWSYLNILDRHNAAQVSRRFRSIALNTAHLWTFINFSNLPSVPRSDIVLKRARSAPLHIRVNSHLRPKPPPLPPILYGHPPPPPVMPFGPLPPPPAVIASIPKLWNMTKIRPPVLSKYQRIYLQEGHHQAVKAHHQLHPTAMREQIHKQVGL